METRVPRPLCSSVGSVLRNLRQNRFVSEMSQHGGRPSSAAGTHLRLCRFRPLLAHFLNLTLLTFTPPETSSMRLGYSPRQPVHAERGLRWPVRPCSACLWRVACVSVPGSCTSRFPYLLGACGSPPTPLCPQEWPGHSPSVTQWL